MITVEQCDESRPRCNRCTKLDQPCIYPNVELSPTFDGFPESGHSPNSTHSRDTSLSLPTGSLTSSTEGSLFSIPGTAHLNLSPEDSDIFAHFLQHTSQISGLEPESQYAWRLGLPRMAIKSPMVMHSVLAVGAMCLCMDIITASGHSDSHFALQEDFDRISHLTAVAIAHHAESIREVGAAIADPDMCVNLDSVLSNAAVMVPYGFMLRRLKVWLSGRVPDSNSSLTGPDTAGMSWIYLCRMVKTAFLGLRDHARAPMVETKPEIDTTGTFDSLLSYIDRKCYF